MTIRVATALLSAPLAAVLSFGCGTSTATSVTSPATARCQPTVAPSATAYGPSGGTGTLNVNVARDCAWSAASQVPWITLTSSREGQGEGSVAYRVEHNGDPVARRGGLAVGDVRVELSQDAAPCRYQVTAIGDPVPGTGGERVIDVRTHAACNWTAASTAPWISVTPASGRGDAAVRAALTPNDGAMRAADVVIAGERVALTQLARALPPAPAPVPAPTPDPSPTPAPAPTPAPPPAPTPGAEVELEGRLTALAGTCPALTFRLDGQTVWTHGRTEFKKGPCQEIRNGSGLEVEGRRMSDGTIRADEVEIEKK